MDKRLRLIYATIIIWLLFGLSGLYLSVSLTSLAIYYVSLSSFIISYIIGEGYRPSDKTPLGVSGPTSKREKMIYITILLWIILGIYGLIKNSDMNELSAYFAALTPFVSTFIFSETFKQNNKKIKTEDNKDVNNI
jgi:hypothetical protein